MRLLFIQLMILALICISGCVTKYSSFRKGDSVVFENKEAQKNLSVEVEGAKFLKKGKLQHLGHIFEIYIFSKDKNYYFVGSTDKDNFLDEEIDKELYKTNGITIKDGKWHVRSFPKLEKKKGECNFIVVSMDEFEHKLIISGMTKLKIVPMSQCREIEDTEDFYIKHPEMTENLITTFEETIVVGEPQAATP